MIHCTSHQAVFQVLDTRAEINLRNCENKGGSTVETSGEARVLENAPLGASFLVACGGGSTEQSTNMACEQQ